MKKILAICAVLTCGYAFCIGATPLGKQLQIVNQLCDRIGLVDSLVGQYASLRRDGLNAGICNTVQSCYENSDGVRGAVDEMVALRAQLWPNFHPGVTQRTDEMICRAHHWGEFQGYNACLIAYTDVAP